ncbi:hypothetical protein NNRS527_00377 [Nitrosospira sp. NRS527]|nr:hypothetical protein NNRS527_00377 [Nitrosospira sp. NRS527]
MLQKDKFCSEALSKGFSYLRDTSLHQQYQIIK